MAASFIRSVNVGQNESDTKEFTRISISAAKIQRKSEITKDLAKKDCLLSYHSALIAGASVRQLIENRALAGQSERVVETRSRNVNSSISAAKIRRKLLLYPFFGINLILSQDFVAYRKSRASQLMVNRFRL